MINEDIIRQQLSSRKFKAIDLEALRELNDAVKMTPQAMKALATKYNISVDYSPQLILLIAYETFIENSVNVVNRDRDIEVALEKYDIERKYDKIADFTNRQSESLRQLAEESKQLGGVSKVSQTESNTALIQKNLNSIRQSLVDYNMAKQKIKSLQTERDDSMRNLAELREKLTEKERSIIEARSEIDRLRRTIAELEEVHLSELAAATIRYGELNEQKASERVADKKLEYELNRVRSNYNAEMERLRGEITLLNGAKVANEEEIRRLRLVEEQNIKTLDTLRENLRLKEHQFLELESNATLEVERNKQQCARNEVELITLQTELTKKLETQKQLSLTFNKAVHTYDARIEEYRTIISGLQNQLLANPETRDLQERLNAAESDKYELKMQIQNLRQNFESQIEEWENERKNLQDEIQRQNEALGSEDACRDERLQLTSKIQALENEQIQANAKIKQLQTVNENLSVRIREREQTEGEESIKMSKISSDLANTQREHKKMKNKFTELEQDLKEKQTEYNNLQKSYKECQSKFSTASKLVILTKTNIDRIIKQAKENKIYPRLFEKIYDTNGDIVIKLFFDAISTMMTNFKRVSQENRERSDQASGKRPKLAEKQTFAKRSKPVDKMSEKLIDETIENVIKSSGATEAAAAAAAAAPAPLDDEDVEMVEKKN